MSRIGGMVRRLYQEELKADSNNGGRTTNGKPGRKNRKLKVIKEALTNRRTVVWCIRIVVVLVALVIALEAVFQFNRLTAWYTVVTARRADVDREFQRRKNLIPNLVFAVSKYAAYEQGVFKYVSDARETLKMIRSSDASRSQVSNVLEKTLSRLVALAEQYPDLKATQSIQDLIKEAANTENRIADVKEKYNKASEIYNQYRTTFPGNVFAFIYRYKALPYIGLEESLAVPVIDLKITEQESNFAQDSEFRVENINKVEGVEE
jgi:LemA protein